MNPVRYLKEHGIKYSLDTFYKYKLDIVLIKLMKLFLQNKPLQDMIVIESHNDFDSNGGALYNYLIKHKYNEKYKIVWLIKHPENVKTPLPPNVSWVAEHKPGFKKNYYKWIAKWISYDQNCGAKLRDDQTTIFMTHGAVGLKDCTGALILPDKLDYVLTASEWWLPYDAKQFLMEPSDKRLRICGYPVHDSLYDDSEGDLPKLTDDHYDKVVLWMPTFRKALRGRDDSTSEQPLGIPLLNTMEEYYALNSYLEENHMLLVLKIHPKQDPSVLKISDMGNIRVLTGESIKNLGIDNYRLMKDVDAMISDYSSVAYDFLHLDKPIAYDLSDLESYTRGIVVEDPKEMMAGHLIKNIDDLYGFLTDIKDENDIYKEERGKMFDKIFKYHDGCSSERVVKLLGMEL